MTKLINQLGFCKRENAKHLNGLWFFPVTGLVTGARDISLTYSQAYDFEGALPAAYLRV
jgi:hypothetical protein